MSTCAACGRTDGGPKLEVLSWSAQNKSGRRPPLLFVHGGWHDAHCWDPYFTGSTTSCTTCAASQARCPSRR